MKSRAYLVFGIIGVILLSVLSLKPILLKTCIALFPLTPPSNPVSAPPEIPAVVPSPTASSPSVRVTTSITPITTESAAETATGGLRVSNPTQHPVRVALLNRSNNTASTSTSTHWDFAPQEGSQTGLLLSLPEKSLDLQPGDILVGFAQDGSRRYWGPYIVGETDLPLWVPEGKEWQLILQP
ncbi:MAG: hypothetical protein WBA13_13595 [Microcoleaceae cyanobacterium]